MIDHIYIIAPEKGHPCKIGLTHDAKARLSSIQSGCWEKLELVISFKCNNAIGIEKQLLRHFAPKLIRGEWFDIYSSEALQMLDEFANKFEIPTIPNNCCRSCGKICEGRRIYCSERCYPSKRANKHLYKKVL